MTNDRPIAILRTTKLKTFGNIGASISHTHRTRETRNADPERSSENDHSAAPEETMQAIRDRIPEKRRKDAVLTLEFFVSASPFWFEDKSRQQQDAYFRDAVQWLEKRHGKENVVGWSIHRDESSPHLVAYVVPLDDKGTLNAKRWTGGGAALSRMQTEFARDVGERHGLERGIEGSKARHQTIKDFYAQIEKPAKHINISPEIAAPQVTRKGLLKTEYETPEMVAERITKTVQSAYSPAVEYAKLAASERRRANEMARTAQTLSREKKEAQEGLQATRKTLAPLLELASLAKGEFIDLLVHAQERVKTIKAEREKAAEQAKIDQERQRRIDDLARVERKTAGAACTFARLALEAIQKAGGDASKVRWQEVEKAAVAESINQHHQEPKDVLAAIAKHSPGMVDPARQKIAETYLAATPTKQHEAGKRPSEPSLDR